jgi:hypothetical protein
MGGTGGGTSNIYTCKQCKNDKIEDRKKIFLNKKQIKECLCGVWWHLPVIPATQEAEAGGSKFQVQPEKLRETLSQTKISSMATDLA